MIARRIHMGGSRRLAGRMVPHWLALVAYLLLTGVMTWPLTPQFLRAIPGDSFDGWQNYWNLWWVKLALVDRVQNPFFTDILFAPTGVGLYFHTLNPFNGLATLPIQLTAGLIPAYNAVVYLSWPLAGYGVFLLTLYTLRGVTGGTRYGAAFVAGAIFTFSPFHMAHLLGHMQVMSLQWIPFYILYLLRALDAGARGQPWLRNALLAGLFLVLTGLCDWYFVLYLMLFTGMLVLWRWGVAGVRWLSSDSHSTMSFTSRFVALARSTLGPPLVAGFVFAVVLSPILVPMVQEVRTHSFMVRPATDLYILSAALVDFLVPNRLHTLFRPESAEWIGNRIAPLSERTISIGYLPLLLVGAALGLDRRRAALWGVVALLFVLLALGPRIHLAEITWDDIPQDNTQENIEAVLRAERSPFGLVNQVVPLVRMSRSVSRYALMVQLGVAVAAGVGLAALSRRIAHRGAGQATRGISALGTSTRGITALWVGALVIVGAEFWVAPYPMSPPDTPEYYSRLDAELPPGALLNLPMNWDRPGYLLYQTVHQRPLTVAYISRDDPRTATDRYPFLQHLRHLGPDILGDEPARVGRTVLADLGVSVVTLDRYKMPGGAEREVTEAVAAQVFGNDAPHYEDDRITVYTVEPPAVPAPYLALGPLHWGVLEIDEADAGEVADNPNAETAMRWRSVGPEPAAVWAYYVPPQSELTIRFAGAPETTLRLLGADNAVLQEVRAAPGGLLEPLTLTVPLPSAADRDPVDRDPLEIRLQAIGGEIRILSLVLSTAP